MRVEWRGGPLDGCVDHLNSPIRNTWVGPDPTDPDQKVVVYLLFTTGRGGVEFRFSQVDTDNENRRISEERGLGS